MLFILNRRLYTDATKTKVLEDGDPAAAFLIGGEGSEVSDEDVKAYGLDDSHKQKEEAKAAEEAEPVDDVDEAKAEPAKDAKTAKKDEKKK